MQKSLTMSGSQLWSIKIRRQSITEWIFYEITWMKWKVLMVLFVQKACFCSSSCSYASPFQCWGGKSIQYGHKRIKLNLGQASLMGLFQVFLQSSWLNQNTAISMIHLYQYWNLPKRLQVTTTKHTVARIKAVARYIAIEYLVIL